MLYMVTFTINIPPMLAYIPYMDPMGYICLYIDIYNNILIYIYIYTYIYIYIYLGTADKFLLVHHGLPGLVCVQMGICVFDCERLFKWYDSPGF